MTAVVVIHASDGRIVDSLSVGWPPTVEESRRVQAAVRLAVTTTLRPAVLCACLEDRATGGVVVPCALHGSAA